MPRFFIDDENISEKEIKIIGEDVKHIKNVLRLSIGSILTLCDQKGNDYETKIKNIDKDCIHTEAIDKKKSLGEPAIEVVLFQSIPKSDKMDFIVQKSVELGVSKIIPVITERTIVKFTDSASIQKKVQRWQKISAEASKQSERGKVPVVSVPLKFEDAVKCVKDYDLFVIPYEKERQCGIRKVIDNKCGIKRIGIMIGPEGGYSEEEILKAITLGAEVVTLGPRILRTETAGMFVVSIIMYQLGDVNL